MNTYCISVAMKCITKWWAAFLNPFWELLDQGWRIYSKIKISVCDTGMTSIPSVASGSTSALISKTATQTETSYFILYTPSVSHLPWSAVMFPPQSGLHVETLLVVDETSSRKRKQSNQTKQWAGRPFTFTAAALTSGDDFLMLHDQL